MAIILETAMCWIYCKKKEAEYCKSSLHLAARLGKLEAVKDLLGKGANVNAQNDKEETPLHLAAEEGHKEIVEDLLDKGENVNAKDNDGSTPFNLTTNEEIKTLLQSTDELLKAARKGDIDAVNRPINEGANVNATDQNGNTPLHLVLKKNNIDIKVLNALLGAKNIDVDATDKLGEWTPLHRAVEKGHKEAVEALLNNGAKSDIVSKYRNTPLHLAAQNGNTEIVKVLLKAPRIDINAKGAQKEKTPLHLAAENGHKEVVEVLLKAEGINVNAVDEDGKTPFNLATDEEIKTLLQPAKESDDGSVDEPLTDSEGIQEEDAGIQQKEKQEGDVQPGSEVIKKENSEEGSDRSQREQGIIAEKGTDVQTGDVGFVASTGSPQTEEQPSSFFGNLFSILMKPFSLIASFFGGFFHEICCESRRKSLEYEIRKKTLRSKVKNHA